MTPRHCSGAVTQRGRAIGQSSVLQRQDTSAIPCGAVPQLASNNKASLRVSKPLAYTPQSHGSTGVASNGFPYFSRHWRKVYISSVAHISISACMMHERRGILSAKRTGDGRQCHSFRVVMDDRRSHAFQYLSDKTRLSGCHPTY